jgi:hypothetical protein
VGRAPRRDARNSAASAAAENLTKRRPHLEQPVRLSDLAGDPREVAGRGAPACASRGEQPERLVGARLASRYLAEPAMRVGLDEPERATHLPGRSGRHGLLGPHDRRLEIVAVERLRRRPLVGADRAGEVAAPFEVLGDDPCIGLTHVLEPGPREPVPERAVLARQRPVRRFAHDGVAERIGRLAGEA